MYSNGLLKDAINNRSICPSFRFSHDHPSNGGTNDGKTTTGQSTNATDEKVNFVFHTAAAVLQRWIQLIINFQKINGIFCAYFIVWFEKIPPPPTNCCMSGCANCVWIQYAEEVSSKLRGGSDAVREIIMKEVQDTNMRAFLEMELRMLKSKEKK